MSLDSAQASTSSSTANGTGGPANVGGMSKEKRFQLADSLRDCAVLVEENGFDEATFAKMFRELTAYVQAQGGSVIATPSVTKAAIPVVVPISTAQPKAPPRASPPTVPPPPSSAVKQKAEPVRVKPPYQHQHSSDSSTALSNQKNYNFLGKISKTINEFGHDLTDIAHRTGFEMLHEKKQATSTKNAQRAKADIASEFGGDDWCEIHCTRGCACKLRKSSSGGQSSQQRTSTQKPSATPGPSERNTKADGSTAALGNPSKPPFQRPVNPNSTLIANGWIEQQRRSKMRTVWKEVLVSLVAGRRPGEETTLWVQREFTNANGATELEALHQIPIKGMQDIHYVDFSTDHRFVIQVYNLSDEFVFRTQQSSAAKNWVSTLRLTREAIVNGVAPPRTNDLQGPPRTREYPSSTPAVSTSYSGEDEKKADTSPTQQQGGDPPQRKKSVNELRAIAHGAGVNTHGMERGELEAIVERIQQAQAAALAAAGPPRTAPHHPPGPPPVNTAAGPPYTPHPPPGPPPADAPDDELLHQEREQAEMRRRAQKAAAEAEEATRKAREEEAAARKAAEEKSRLEAGHLRTQAEEEKRRRAAAEQQAEAERRKQHEEHLRQQQAQQQWQQQQWQKQQEEQRRRAAAEAEQRRRHEEYLRQQQWQQQQWQQQQARPPPPGGYPQQHPNPQQPHPQYPPPPHGHGPMPQPQQPRPPPPHPGAATGASPVNMKYAKMATEEDISQSTITAIKHNILIQWALMPPTLQMLRPIEDLLTTIHNVFPPVSGVPGHDYFQKWKALSKEDLFNGYRVDEEKLKKAVRKLRFFLHPDKLAPQNLSEEQSFVCKMLWDITNDANDEFFKRKEDLDWIK